MCQHLPVSQTWHIGRADWWRRPCRGGWGSRLWTQRPFHTGPHHGGDHQLESARKTKLPLSVDGQSSQGSSASTWRGGLQKTVATPPGHCSGKKCYLMLVKLLIHSQSLSVYRARDLLCYLSPLTFFPPLLSSPSLSPFSPFLTYLEQDYTVSPSLYCTLTHDPPPSMFPILRLKASISCITIPSFGLGFLVVVDLCLNAHERFWLCIYMHLQNLWSV